MPYVNFSIDVPYDPHLARSTQGLAPRDTVTIDSNTDLSPHVTGKSGACVQGITLRTISHAVYKYGLYVDGKGPKGGFASALHLKFKDRSGDFYTLKLISSSMKEHSVKYNSSSPDIVSFKWSDKSIPDW
ncbi:hypothetical protein OHA84_36665 [Streptomyces sp. NBC_00513]|uniref:hypothetical protein n=1 Tax=unclassified Streptomyces TaxID=2593676 RepID=UPI0022594F7D|nr:hypothetical protein [Streptomyces sp. NBC_00424]MCX5070966.1 hypothetical protein [Streptomyces sp. NBC_00424]WUD45598.1 hypothetical protein OHA84_36665 [Streptomyces sp. NBC_00513]